MKKIIYLIMAVFAIGFTFIACSDDDDNNPKVGSNPSLAAAGTYEGIYVQVDESGDTVATDSSGIIVITGTDSAYYANITFYSVPDSLDFNLPAIANITYANSGFKFWNASGDGTDNLSMFSGTIDGSGYIDAYFRAVVYSGRRSSTYHYYFEGYRQGTQGQATP